MEDCEVTYAPDDTKVVCLRCRWTGTNKDCSPKTVYSPRFRISGLPIQV
jgi:hypothetical protein